MALILLRHTRVDLPPGTCYGQLDAPLLQPADPPFETVAAQLRQRLAGPLTRLVSSPLQRARQLAAHLAAQLAEPLQIDARWQELHFGRWEGRHWDDIPRHESEPWTADVHHRAPPGGETHAALSARVHAAMDDCAEAARQGTVLVVCHAGPMRVALARAQGLGLAQQFALSLPFGGWVALQPQHAGDRPHWQLEDTAP